MNATRIPVDIPGRGYEVTIGGGLLGQAGPLLARFAPTGRAVVITDAAVGALYGGKVVAELERAGLRADLLDFPAGEKHKNLATYVSLMGRLLGLAPAIDRSTLIVTLGGGVAGDVGGFVAATALRGLGSVNLPTTLLADVDAAVGGKTGVDAPAGKNLIGAFHQPRAVLIDPAALATLPVAQLVNGLAECVKHAVIADESLLEFIEANAAGLLAADVELCHQLIARNVAIKAGVVAVDERESSGRRELLNFGHTIGHAVETAAGYAGVSHGQAVALGMSAACAIATGRGLLTPAAAARVAAVLAAVKLPARFDDLPGLPAAARDAAVLRELMLHDKKARAGVVRFVLPRGLGSAAVFDDVTGAEIARALEKLAG
jgi:3-dehydroquinate synthase